MQRPAHSTTTHKTPLIMIHGFRGTHHGLARIDQELTQFQTIIPDLPGFGEGETLEEHNLDQYVEWLHHFMIKQSLSETPALLGHSFGSIITAAYAAKYPDSITKLILVNPIGSPALEGPKAVLTKLALFYYFMGKKLPSSLAHQWLSAKSIVMVMSVTMAKTKDKKLRRYIHDQHLTYFSRFHNPKTLSEAFTTSVTHTVREFARNITVPTLLIAGDIDDITPLEKQQELVKLFPHAKLVVIKDVGHLTHYETPDQVAHAITSFMK